MIFKGTCICGAEVWKPHQRPAEYCSVRCANIGKGLARITGNSRPRNVSDRAQPGLRDRQRRALLKRWIKQGRTCTFCPAPADTVDHVIPLVRGGTNFEGNLTPACRSCNSRKQARLVIEFLHGRPPGTLAMPCSPYVPRVKAEPKPPVINHCKVCGAETTRRVFCSKACCVVNNARVNREKYVPKFGRRRSKYDEVERHD